MTAIIRTIAKRVLKAYDKGGLKFSVRATNFPCDCHGNCYYNVTIKGWNPDRKAETIKRDIVHACNKFELGVLVAFEGKGFAQGG